ncbi:MAG: DUF3459 domain-containing protein, partial [Desulfatirhabdiaceae bacterium]|nr:DUF3459 domain-containing protein [Desulfatirhabdiaceae bacterium]
SRSIPSHRFVIVAQNHDQVGNRMQGDRLSSIVSFEALKMAAGIILLSANLPLLFMGEEYGETAPFPYFVSHSDPGLIEAVRRGRREEFTSFGWDGEAPDPQAEETFRSAKLRPELRLSSGPHRHLWEFYSRLIALRRSSGVLSSTDPSQLEVFRVGRQRIGCIRRWNDTEDICIIFHAADTPIYGPVPLPAGSWKKVINSAEKQWGSSGSAIEDTIASDGEVAIELSPYNFIVLSNSHAR